MSPYEQVVAALKHGGFMKAGKPICPTCPPTKRRGFEVTEVKATAGRPATVLLCCFRGCDTLTDIVPALGLDPSELYDGGMRQEVLFDRERYCSVTVRGFKALPESSARTFGIAFGIGSFTTPLSPYRLLRSPRAWEAVRVEAGITARAVRKDVAIWCDRMMAHRCEDRGILALYRGPLERCPCCGRLTLEQRSDGSTTTRKYTNKGTRSSAPRHGLNTTQTKEPEVPLSGTRSSFSNDDDMYRGGAT